MKKILNLVFITVLVLSPAYVSYAAPTDFFNQTLITGLAQPVSIDFDSNGRMYIAEMNGKIKVVQPGASAPDQAPILDLNDIYTEPKVLSISFDPDFQSNGYMYIFYSANMPAAIDRVSRFTVESGAIDTSSEFLIWQHDTESPHHRGGTAQVGPDGKMYISTGDGFDSTSGANHVSQRLDTLFGKILRINLDGSIPTDNPFYDGAGPNRDEIWARGLRNPFRFSFDRVTGRMYIADVGGNNNATAMEEINIGQAGANYGWPFCEGNCTDPSITDPLYTYAHDGRDASITGGIVYRGGNFPAEYEGSYFFGEYVMNFIRRLTFNTDGSVNALHFFEPADGSTDGPYGDIVDIKQGPDGALYYVDIGVSWDGNFGLGSVRRISYVPNNQPPEITEARAVIGEGFTVSFFGAATDPENEPLTYMWDFGDGQTSNEANPIHTYSGSGQYTARLSVSDSEQTVFSDSVIVVFGIPPVVQIQTPVEGSLFRGGEAIQFSGTASDVDGDILPEHMTWSVIFHHGSHTHPDDFTATGASGTFVIPTEGHDFEGETSYRLILTVVDEQGLTASDSVEILPEKVNLQFMTSPGDFVLDFNQETALVVPFTKDSLIGFRHQIEAPLWVASNGFVWNFDSWSNNSDRVHTLVTPETDATYTAHYTQNPAGALEFDGIDDAIFSRNIPLNEEFTYEAWVKRTTDFGRYETIMSDANSNFSQVMFSLYVDGGNSVCTGVSDQFVYYQNGGNEIFCSGVSAQLNKWYHVAVTRDALGTLRYFVNGELSATKVNAATPTDSDSILVVGRAGSTSAVANFGGIIDEVRISNQARYTSNFSPTQNPFANDSSTEVLFHFDEPQGQIVWDLSGNKRHGQLGLKRTEDALDPVRSLESPVTKLMN